LIVLDCRTCLNLFVLAENSPACKQTGVPPELFGICYPAPWHEDLREVNSTRCIGLNCYSSCYKYQAPLQRCGGRVWDPLPPGLGRAAEDAALHMLLHDASLSALCQLNTDMGLVCLKPLTVARAFCASADQIRCLFERHLKSASEHMLRAQHSTVQAVALLLRQKPHQVCVASSANGISQASPQHAS